MLGLLIILFLILFILTLIKPAKGLFWIPDVNKRSRWFSLLYLLAVIVVVVSFDDGLTDEERDHKRSVKMKLKKHQINTSAGNNSFQCKVNGDNIEGGKDEYIAKLATLRNGDVVDIRASVDEVSIGEWSHQINLILRGDIVWK
jgi:hypothetical protein